MVKLCCPNLLSFGHTPRPPAFRRRPDRPAWRSGIECRPVQRVQRLGVCVVPCVVCLASGTVCAAACDVQAVRVRWRLVAPPAGYTAAAQPRPVSPVTTEKIKKTHPAFTNQNPSDCASLQKFQKIQKRPLSGS